METWEAKLMGIRFGNLGGKVDEYILETKEAK